ncbi:MAG TPA: MFS transporter [Micropepsaceae bacterium]|nr:MFS transporter [Micropepsaceae bacterium]
MRKPLLSPPGVVLALLCAMYFLLFVNRTNIAIAGPLMRTDLGLSNTEFGFALSAFAFPYALFQLFGGMIGDRFGPRATLAVSTLIVCLATAWTGLAGGFSSLLAARLALGIGEGAAFPTATRAMAAWTPVGRWGFAQGITHTFSRIGNAATALIVSRLIALVSWRGSFYLLAPVNLVWMALWFWYDRDDPREHKGVTPDILAKLPARGPGEGSRNIPWTKLARRILPVTTVDFCYGWTLWIFQNWIQSYFVDVYGMDTARAAVYTFAVLSAGVVGDTVGGILTDYILHRTGSLVVARRSVIMAGFLGGAVFLIPVGALNDLFLVALSIGVAFFFVELIVAPIWAVPMDIAPRYAGTASGMMNFGFGLAGIVSPVFFGYMIDLTGTWTVPFIVSIALLILGAVLASYLRPDRPFSESDAAVAAPAAT